jgi:hypothetical protein
VTKETDHQHPAYQEPEEPKSRRQTDVLAPALEALANQASSTISWAKAVRDYGGGVVALALVFFGFSFLIQSNQTNFSAMMEMIKTDATAFRDEMRAQRVHDMERSSLTNQFVQQQTRILEKLSDTQKDQAIVLDSLRKELTGLSQWLQKKKEGNNPCGPRSTGPSFPWPLSTVGPLTWLVRWFFN